MGKSSYVAVITGAAAVITTAITGDIALHYLLDSPQKQETIQHAPSSQTNQPTYEEWLVQEHLALPRVQILQLSELSGNYRLSDYPSSTYCMTRVSNNVSYQAGFVEPTTYNNVTETISGKPGMNHLLRQEFPKTAEIGGTTLSDGIIITDDGIQARFYDSDLDGVADRYEIWHGDIMRVIPTSTSKKESRLVTINQKAKEAFAEKEDPRHIGFANFEIMRQQNYTEALLRFLNNPEGNKPCSDFYDGSKR